MKFLSRQNRELSELAKARGYSDDVQKLLAKHPICEESSVHASIMNGDSEKDLVICVFSSCNLDGPVIMTNDPEKENKQYYDEVHAEAVEKYQKHVRNGRFVLTEPFPYF